MSMTPTANGTELRFTDTGAGLPLVFLHGFPFSRGVWQKQVDALGFSYRVIAPDLRGLGDSEPGAGPTTMEQCAADVRELLLQLATGPVVLIGHSMGGYVALAFARRFPEMLQGLVLVSTRAGRDTDEAAARRRVMADEVNARGVQVVIMATAPMMLAADNEDAQMVEEVRACMATSKPAGVVGALLGMAERPDATAFLAQVRVPTLVVTGAEDTLIPPAESDTLAQGIRGAQLNVIPRAGHLVAFEQADAFNDVLTNWLHRAGLATPFNRTDPAMHAFVDSETGDPHPSSRTRSPSA